MAQQTLAQRFREAAGDGARAGADDEARLARIVDRCRAQWPGLDVGDGPFVEALGRRVTGEAQPLADAEGRAVEDLYLGLGCAQGSAAALSAFSTAMEPVLRAIHHRWPAVLAFEDFRQTLYEKLFVGDNARIRSYAARGSLHGWVKIVATRMLCDLKTAAAEPTAATDYDAVLVSTMMSPPDDLAHALLKQQLRPAVQQAIEQSMRALHPHQRVLLRQRFIYGLSLAELARAQQVHRVTVSKQLAKARAAVQTSLRARLGETLGAESQQVDSILRMCLSQLDVRFDELLRSR